MKSKKKKLSLGFEINDYFSPWVFLKEVSRFGINKKTIQCDFPLRRGFCILVVWLPTLKKLPSQVITSSPKGKKERCCYFCFTRRTLAARTPIVSSLFLGSFLSHNNRNFFWDGSRFSLTLTVARLRISATQKHHSVSEVHLCLSVSVCVCV